MSYDVLASLAATVAPKEDCSNKYFEVYNFLVDSISKFDIVSYNLRKENNKSSDFFHPPFRSNQLTDDLRQTIISACQSQIESKKKLRQEVLELEKVIALLVSDVPLQGG